jgi:hypothetical protein
MRRVKIRLPMHRRDPESGELRQTYATYEGTEEMVSNGERQRNRTARLFALKNSKNEDYQFKVKGNGQYEMYKASLGLDRPIATGTMMDAIAPEIIALAG